MTTVRRSKDSTIVICTMAGDHHALAVATALKRKGERVLLWRTTDFPTKNVETVAYDGIEEQLIVNLPGYGGILRGSEIRSLWNRRPLMELAPAQLVPADRVFAEIQCTRFRAGLLDILSASVDSARGLCVNRWNGAVAAENKIWQHRAALRVGLLTPRSLYTNDPTQIRGFIKKHGGRVAFKLLRSAMWKSGADELGCYTNTIGLADLVEDHLLQAVPGIYQELVPKAYELRVTIMGNHIFTARINSQETVHGDLDWRREYDSLSMVPWELPKAVSTKAQRLLRHLGLVFGCLDFIVTPDGRHIFLEVNQAGQFLFVERDSGMALLDAFSEFLLQGRVDFSWSEPLAPIRLEAVKEEVMKAVEAEAQTHVQAVDRAVDERRCPSCLRAFRLRQPAAAAERTKLRRGLPPSSRIAPGRH
jgi:hypothetical protein